MGRYTGKSCRLLTMLVMTIIYFVVEIVVGYVTNSVALVADSFHMLSDTVALIIGLASVRIAKWPSRTNTFGWVRAEILGALVNAVFLLALCFSILVESLKRLLVLEEIERPVLLLCVGLGGLVLNILGLFLFHHHVHGHSHKEHNGSEHEETQELKEDKNLVNLDMETLDTNSNLEYNGDVVTEFRSNTESPQQMNMMGVFLHVAGDALGSVVVIISSLIIWLAKGSWRFYLDPAMSFAMVILIFSTTIPLLKRSSLILLQTAPPFLDHDKLQELLTDVEGVLGVHEFHVWQLTGKRVVLSAHIVCNNLREYMKVAAVVKDLFHKQGVHSTTIQPEFVEVTASQEELLQCKLPCVDKYRDCMPDTCCGHRNSVANSEKSRRESSVSSRSARVSVTVTTTQSTLQHLAEEETCSIRSFQTQDRTERGPTSHSACAPDGGLQSQTTGEFDIHPKSQNTGSQESDARSFRASDPRSSLETSDAGGALTSGLECQSKGALESISNTRGLKSGVVFQSTDPVDYGAV